MASLMKLIHQNVPENAIGVARMSRAGCRLTMERLPHSTDIVDLYKAGIPGDQPRADFLFVTDQYGGGVIPNRIEEREALIKGVLATE